MNSIDLFAQAQRVIPGGVNSPVRSFAAVDLTPKFIDCAIGPYLYDVDGNEYIDYVGSWGAMILGHNHPAIQKAIYEACQKGVSFGAPCEIETKMAQCIIELVPSIEKIRMVNSGTEATMSAIRLARGYTNKNKIIKFIGHYHGHADALLVEAGSGELTYKSVSSSSGIPPESIQDTLVCAFNSTKAVDQLFNVFSSDIACVIVEPVSGNMGCVPPEKNFLNYLREKCHQHDSLLIFDEVMTGFRVALRGAQSFYHVDPDLTTLGKIIGGGLPVGAFGGRKEIMDYISPLGPVYQAGTMSGNPLVMSAGYAALCELKEQHDQNKLLQMTESFCSEVENMSNKYGIDLVINRVPGMFSLFFTSKKSVLCLDDVSQCNHEKFKEFYHNLLEQGVYFAPSPFESCFISLAHETSVINKTLQKIELVFSKMSS